MNPLQPGQRMTNLGLLKRDFGAFYPTDHMVVGFRVQMDAERVLQYLAKQGAPQPAPIELSAQEMIEFAEKNMQEASAMANIGACLSTLQVFLDAAKEGVYFLVIPTPDDAAAGRVTQAIYRVPFVLAERYYWLAIATVA